MSIPKSLKNILVKIALLLGTVVLAGVGVLLGNWSFDQVHHMRQLERVPPTPVASVISGEVNMSGRIEAAGETLESPDTGTESVYYRYVVERKEKDSDGDTRWKTITDETRSVDFVLRDDTGKIPVTPSSNVEFAVEEDAQRTSGSKRYTEYRLEPGSEIFVFGYADQVQDQYQVGFNHDGSFQPIISEESELGERQKMAMWSALGIVGGLGSLAFAIVFLLGLFRVHHSAMYLVAVSAVMVVSLFYQGLQMMKADLVDADTHAERSLEEGRDVIDTTLSEHDISWEGDFAELGSFSDKRYAGLDADVRDRLKGVRLLLAQSVERTNDNLSRFPESLLGPMWGVKRLDPLALPEAERAELSELEDTHEPTRLKITHALIAILAGGLGATLATWFGLKKVGIKRTIENVPTSPIEGVAYGLAEIKGTAELAGSDAPLTGPLSGDQCVYYHYVEKKKVQDGKKSRWRTVRDETRSTPFYCRDDSGRMYIDDDGARFIAADKRTRRAGNRRYTEWIITPGEPIYALGSATIDAQTHENLELTQGEDDLPFIVSSLPEDEVMYREARTAFHLLNAGIIATLVAGLGVSGSVASFGPLLYTATAGFSVAYLFVALFFLYYNDLIFLRERVQRNWSNIDVALKKRYDLITNLAGTVQGYLDHESELQEALGRARSGASELSPDDDAIQAQEQARNQIVATIEAYPDLKGQELVADFMQTLTDVENEIALMRDGYNDAVERLNTRAQKFPELFIAKMFGFEKATHFHTYADEREAPQIAEMPN
ncbi:MAG: LemA family protein [Persicimonas sp.]